MLEGGIVVDDGIDHFAGPDLALGGIKAVDELLVPVTSHVTGDHRAFEHVEGDEQRGGAVYRAKSSSDMTQ